MSMRTLKNGMDPNAKRLDPDVTLMDYFFKKKKSGNDIILEARTDLVRRDELWAMFNWYERKVRQQNVWWRVLWRALKGAALVRIDPFAWAHSKRERGGTTRDPLAEGATRPEPKKTIDAGGKVVEA